MSTKMFSKMFYRVVAFPLCITLSSCALPRIMFDGKIYEEITDVTQITPIGGAKLQLQNDEFKIDMTGYSASDGSYSFAYPVDDHVDENGQIIELQLDFTLRITRIGFQTISVFVRGSLGRSANNDYYMLRETN